MMLPLRDKLLYSLGGGVFSVKESAYTFFVLLFYTQVLGLSGAVTGLVLFLGIVWDAITDPLIGVWSDRLNTRWGRRHPFMVAGAIPLGFGFIGLFSPPADVVENSNLLATWLLFWTLWIRTAMTAFLMPSIALSAEMTSDYHERSQLLGLRIGALFVVTLLLPAFALTVIFAEINGVDGRFVAGNYPQYGWISAVIVWAVAGACIWGTRGYIPVSIANARKRPTGSGWYSLVEDFKRTFSNKNFRSVLYYAICASASYGISMTLTVLIGTYYFEFSAGDMALTAAIPALIAVPLAVLSLKPLGRRFSKQQIISLTLVGMMLNAPWPFALRGLGWLPENGHPLVLAVGLIQLGILMYLFVIRVVCGASIIADITDEHELEHGLRQEAGFFAAINFSDKLATAVGPLYGGLLLDLIGLQEGMEPGSLEQGTLDSLAIGMLLGSLPLMFMAWRFSLKVSLNEEQLQSIQQQLAERELHFGNVNHTDGITSHGN